MKRKITIALIILLICSLFLLSCEDVFDVSNFLDIVSRPTEPTVAMPTIKSTFDDDGTERKPYFYISWDKDSGADSYMLTRSIYTSGTINTSEVYNGNDNFYRDYSVYDNLLYRYNLYKIRKDRMYPETQDDPASASYMILNSADRNEPNNTIHDATSFSNATSFRANTYVAQYGDGEIIKDPDWYSIRIMPGKMANFQINQIYPTLQDGTPSYLTYFVEGRDATSKTLIQNGRFSILNDTKGEKEFFFKIEGADLTVSNVIRKIEYQLELQNIS